MVSNMSSNVMNTLYFRIVTDDFPSQFYDIGEFDNLLALVRDDIAYIMPRLVKHAIANLGLSYAEECRVSASLKKSVIMYNGATELDMVNMRNIGDRLHGEYLLTDQLVGSQFKHAVDPMLARPLIQSIGDGEYMRVYLGIA